MLALIKPQDVAESQAGETGDIHGAANYRCSGLIDGCEFMILDVAPARAFRIAGDLAARVVGREPPSDGVTKDARK